MVCSASQGVADACLALEPAHSIRMPRRSKIPVRRDVNVLMARMAEALGDLEVGEKNPAAVALGRLGGQRGGPARAEKLSPEERKRIARKAAIARWRKRNGLV